MHGIVKPIEQALMPVFKGLPSLPEGARKFLVKIWPILALVFGLLQLLGAWGLWQLGHTTNTLIYDINQYSVAVGDGAVAPTLGVFYYLGLAVLVIDAIILLLAVAPLNARQKKGWDLLLLGTTLNLVYGIVLLFDAYGGVSSLFGSLLGSAIGYYLLFQIREYYTGAKTAQSTSTRPTTPTQTTPKA